MVWSLVLLIWNLFVSCFLYLEIFKFHLSAAPRGRWPNSRKKLCFTAAPNVVSSRDRAMTVREWDPVLRLLGHILMVIYPHPFNLEAPRGMGPCRAPLLDSHGSVNWRRFHHFLVFEVSASTTLVRCNTDYDVFVASATGRVREATTNAMFFL